MTWRGGASDGDEVPSRRSRAVRSRALLVLAGVALLQAGVGASLVAGSGSTPDLTLVSDADGTPLVSATGMAPGHPVERCLRLSYGNAVDDDRLRLMTTASGTLADHMFVRIETGTGGNAASCAGFSGAVVYSGTLANLRTTNGTEQTALPLRTLSGGNGAMTVRLRFTVANTNAAQGANASANLVWIADAVGDRTPPPPVVTPVDPPKPVPTIPPSVPPAPVPVPVPVQPAPPPAGVPDPPAPAPIAPDPVPVPEPEPEVPTQPVTPVAPSTGSTPTSPALPPVQPVAPAAPAGDPGDPAATAPAPDAGPGDGNADDSAFTGGAKQVGRVFASGAKAVASVASDLAGSVHEQVFKPMAVAAAPAAKGGAIGLGGTAPLLGAFLLIQSRIDRRDPKLALAPVHADPDLTFNDIPRGPLHSRETPSGETSS